MMDLNPNNLIGYGESRGSGKTLQGVNPAGGQVLPGEFYLATTDDVEQAMTLATRAFAEYKLLPNEQRAAFLDAIAQEIEALGDALVQRASAETGLSESRIIGERGRTTGQLRMFADFIRAGHYVEASIDTAIPERQPIPKPDLRKMMVPLGPVVVFGSSNFPLAYSVAGGDTASALAAGCPVLVKAHPGHPGTSALVGQAIVQAARTTGMPEGVFSLLYDSGFQIGQALVGHPAARAVGFTGSLAGGRALFDLAAQREVPIPVFAEMGSINPSVLLPQTLAQRAAEIARIYAGSITLGVGQFCTNPGLILAIKGEAFDNFIAILSEEISKALPATMLHSGISAAFRQKTREMAEQLGVTFVARAAEEGQEYEGRPMVAKAPAQAFISNPRLHEEVFGPFSLLIECADQAELEACVAVLKGQLTVTIRGEEDEFGQYRDLINQLHDKAGRVIFNGVPTGVEVCPSMTHGGPYPATTDSRFTAVGVHAIKRFLRPVTYQNAPPAILPEALQDDNPLHIWRLINGELSRDPIK